ncbi:hypothetical protein OUZ56_011852 [Daphnia magna]|uniref:Uncharacterized protein n=1 Tax=Daphnia magna TaxID=35525 RepID=A0ABQ9Z1B2_9CRUS|nr:hypothetical protein OUZ56_011852 [Daphnia magna]
MKNRYQGEGQEKQFERRKQLRQLKKKIGLIKVADPYFELIFMLNRIMDIVFAPNVNPINKFHHLVHYPAVIRENGPPVRYWCMRFEAYHNIYKRVAHHNSNFVKIAKKSKNLVVENASAILRRSGNHSGLCANDSVTEFEERNDDIISVIENLAKLVADPLSNSEERFPVISILKESSDGRQIVKSFVDRNEAYLC